MLKNVELNAEERAVLDWVDSRADHMIETVKDWASIHSGSKNPEGLETMRAKLGEAFAELGGEISASELPRARGTGPDSRRVAERGPISD